MGTCDVGRTAIKRRSGVSRSSHLTPGVGKKCLATWKTEVKQMRENAARSQRLKEQFRFESLLTQISAPSSSASPVSLATAAILSALCNGPFIFPHLKPGSQNDMKVPAGQSLHF